MHASAPGKIMLAGEYAVLHGVEAVMMAVDRRVVARVADDASEPTAFVRAACAAVAAHTGRPPCSLSVDSSALYHDDGRKLGLGSSAAVTVASVACALRASGVDAPGRALVHRLSHAAHAEAQAALGAAGSGADIAASTYGGLTAFSRPNNVRPLSLPAGLELVAVWTGQPADTATLVAAVEAFAAANADAHRTAMDDIELAATALAGAKSVAEAITAVADGAIAAAGLGAAAGVDIETDVHRRIAGSAVRFGGAAKPTGAGGGDIAVAAFGTESASERFRADIAEQGMVVLDLSVSSEGVSV
jgi:phosphomevalonate kinase